MKPLVREERLWELERIWRRKNHPCLRQRDKRTQGRAFLEGARAALDELGVTDIAETPAGETLLVNLQPGEVVLIRAKKED